MKRYTILTVLLLAVLTGLCGCTKQKEQDGSWQTAEFTVMDLRELPEELLELIEQNKEREIRMTYEDGTDLYLIRGYGKQKSGGYSIAAAECTESETMIRLHTQLIGPRSEEELPEEPSYPVLVIRMENREKECEID